jgi:UDP-glucose 4-epimerase
LGAFGLDVMQIVRTDNSRKNDRLSILITGASGFLGSALIRALADTKATVYASVRNHATLTNRLGMPLPANVEPLRCDLSDIGSIQVLPPRVDVVIHLANSHQFKSFPEGAADVFAVNVGATAQLLNWMSRVGARQFIFASTGNVYSDHLSPISETWQCEGSGYYAASKHAGEILARSYASLMQVDVLRIFGLYGPGQDKGLVRSIFHGVNDETEFKLNDGKGTVITPTYITDAVSAILLLLTAAKTNSYNIYNLAGDEAVSFKALAEKIGILLGKKPRFLDMPEPATYLLGSAATLRERLGWRPRIMVDEGLQQMYAALQHE